MLYSHFWPLEPLWFPLNGNISQYAVFYIVNLKNTRQKHYKRVQKCSDGYLFGNFQFWPSQNHRDCAGRPKRHTIGFFTTYAWLSLQLHWAIGWGKQIFSWLLGGRPLVVKLWINISSYLLLTSFEQWVQAILYFTVGFPDFICESSWFFFRWLLSSSEVANSRYKE